MASTQLDCDLVVDIFEHPRTFDYFVHDLLTAIDAVANGGEEEVEENLISLDEDSEKSEDIWDLISIKIKANGHPEEAEFWVGSRLQQFFLVLIKDYSDCLENAKNDFDLAELWVPNTMGLFYRIHRIDLDLASLVGKELADKIDVLWDLYEKRAKATRRPWQINLLQHDKLDVLKAIENYIYVQTDSMMYNEYWQLIADAIKQKGVDQNYSRFGDACSVRFDSVEENYVEQLKYEINNDFILDFHALENWDVAKLMRNEGFKLDLSRVFNEARKKNNLEVRWAEKAGFILPVLLPESHTPRFFQILILTFKDLFYDAIKSGEDFEVDWKLLADEMIKKFSDLENMISAEMVEKHSKKLAANYVDCFEFYNNYNEASEKWFYFELIHNLELPVELFESLELKSLSKVSLEGDWKPKGLKFFDEYKVREFPNHKFIIRTISDCRSTRRTGFGNRGGRGRGGNDWRKKRKY